MSTLKVNNLQVGQDGTAANNYTLYQPASPDGTVRLGYGVAGSVTDILTLKNSRLGIGTNDPQGQLTVVLSNNGLEFNPGSAQAIVSYNRSTSAYKPVGMQGSTVGLYIGGYGESLHISSTGTVGLSTSSPASRLHVHAPNTDLATIRLSGTATGQIEYDIRQGIVGTNNAGFSIRDITNSTTRFVITSDGKIGIGTDTPSELLHLESGWTKQILKSTNLNTASSLIFDTHNINTADFLLGQLAGRWNGNDVAYINFEAGSDTTNKDDGVITFLTSSASSTPVERMRITSADGDICIGGHSSNYANSPLEVRGTNAGGDVAIRVTNNSTASGTQAGIIFTTTTADYTTAGIGFERGTADALRFYVGQSTGGGGFTNATERLRLTTDGNLNLGNKNHLSHHSTVDSLQIGYALNLYEDSYSNGTDNYVVLGNNVYYNSGNKYMRDDEASRIMQQAGTFYFQSAAAGTAGNAITFNDVMRITNTGLFGIGHDSPTVYGRMTVAMPSQSGGAAIQVANSSLGSGDGTTTNIVLRSVNNNGSHWADAEYRASQHWFSREGDVRLGVRQHYIRTGGGSQSSNNGYIPLTFYSSQALGSGYRHGISTTFLGQISPGNSGNDYLHVKIDMPAGAMWWLHSWGYTYVGGAIHNSQAVGYTYGNSIIATSVLNENSNRALHVYRASDNTIVMRIYTAHGTSNAWGYFAFEGGFDGICGNKPDHTLRILAYTWTSSSAAQY